MERLRFGSLVSSWKSGLKNCYDFCICRASRRIFVIGGVSSTESWSCVCTSHSHCNAVNMSGCEVKPIVKLSFPYVIICVLLLGGVELLLADGSAQSAPAHPHSRFPRLPQVPASQESNRDHLQVK